MAITRRLRTLSPRAVIVSTTTNIGHISLRGTLVGGPITAVVPGAPISMGTNAVNLSLGPAFSGAVGSAVIRLLGSLNSIILIPRRRLSVINIVNNYNPTFISIFVSTVDSTTMGRKLGHRATCHLVTDVIGNSNTLTCRAQRSPTTLHSRVTSPTNAAVQKLTTLRGRNFHCNIVSTVSGTDSRSWLTDFPSQHRLG